MEAKGRYTTESIEYIAKIADGGMRDAITLLDKCLAYSTELTLENVVKALGTVDYNVMFELTLNILHKNQEAVIEIIEDIHNEGKDIKRFVKQYVHFLLDIQKFSIGCDWKYLNIPCLTEFTNILNNFTDLAFTDCANLLEQMNTLNANIKYSDTAKLDLETELLLFMKE